jgi:2-aminomuconate deaminase
MTGRPRPQPLANYAPARRAGDFVFVSGASARQADGSLAAGVGAQTEATLANIAATLGDHGCTLAELVEAQVFLVDMADPARFPARTTVAVRALPQPGLLVEIRAVAWKRA